MLIIQNMHRRDSIPVWGNKSNRLWTYIVTNGPRILQNSSLIIKSNLVFLWTNKKMNSAYFLYWTEVFIHFLQDYYVQSLERLFIAIINRYYCENEITSESWLCCTQQGEKSLLSQRQNNPWTWMNTVIS